MPEQNTILFFIGMGLRGLSTCSLQSLEALEKCETIYIEPYTNFTESEIPPSFQNFVERLEYLRRDDLEENSDEFLEKIKDKIVAILIPGDPFIATTHISLRVAASERGYSVNIIHNSSIISAAISSSGLSSYRFGRSVSCPLPNNPSEVPYRIIQKNKLIEAHTLVLLDIDTEKNRFLSIGEAITILIGLESEFFEKVITNEDTMIGLAHIGYNHEFISAGSPEQVVMSNDWRKIGPPQVLIVCANSLHFEEQEVLSKIWGSSK
ncbi:MAG: diphthine synthase [Candidatus Hodarchaeales archaeon]